MRDLRELIKGSFKGKRVVIVGDLVADQFLNGTISRVSREAPVFILRHESTETLPGAGANAAANVASLGGIPVLIGLVGEDDRGAELLEKLGALGVPIDHVIRSGEVRTTTKVRVLAGQNYAARQQVIRIDYENSGSVTTQLQQALRERLALAACAADAVIISDYGGGVVSPELFGDALELARDISVPVIVDSRYSLENYGGATAATPNRQEVEEILGPDFTDEDCSRLRARLGLKALLVTNGNQGMKLFEDGRPVLDMPAVGAPDPIDVTGAGDTVIAAFALATACAVAFAEAATIANHAGGIVVMKKATATVSAEELGDSLAVSQLPLASSHAE